MVSPSRRPMRVNHFTAQNEQFDASGMRAADSPEPTKRVNHFTTHNGQFDASGKRAAESPEPETVQEHRVDGTVHARHPEVSHDEPIGLVIPEKKIHWHKADIPELDLETLCEILGVPSARGVEGAVSVKQGSPKDLSLLKTYPHKKQPRPPHDLTPRNRVASGNGTKATRLPPLRMRGVNGGEVQSARACRALPETPTSSRSCPGNPRGPSQLLWSGVALKARVPAPPVQQPDLSVLMFLQSGQEAKYAEQQSPKCLSKQNSSSAREDSADAKPTLHPEEDPVLQSVVQRMSKTLQEYYRRRGVHWGVTTNWSRFFAGKSDTTRSGCISFDELDGQVRGRLQANISRYELCVFWERLDPQGKGMIAQDDLILLLYRADLSTWPSASTQDLQRTVKLLHMAANHWDFAKGQWFGIFKKMCFQTDKGTRRICFDDLERYIRGMSFGQPDLFRELPG
eukprot:gnl/TRDRNA2_/TRDRNA2_164728_c0_seq1.p1 gnl/TRDRNA2_/TRDRNA2_164728_c0~~gnl/TRDRNA2_/TRDRNA2_164728_c0_seq1.p1  ORF type:complete len:455 (-),score=50.46 gnl/TRDRNA2_/TRDRNA2_164728_c0_seq1:13-1377(-)